MTLILTLIHEFFRSFWFPAQDFNLLKVSNFAEARRQSNLAYTIENIIVQKQLEYFPFLKTTHHDIIKTLGAQIRSQNRK
jgi:hypothetical protein